MGADVVDYPPHLLIKFAAQSNLDFTSPKICVEGLDRKCGFNLFIPVSRKGRSRKASVHDELLCYFLASSIPGDKSATKSKVQESSSAASPDDESATNSKVQEPPSAASQS